MSAMVPVSGVTTHFDYTCFFHYRHDYNVPVLFKWIQENSDEAVATLEHTDHDNKTDAHLQVWMRRSEPWTTSMTNAWGVNGKMGKMLVVSKVPNEGEKSAKRWSKRQSFITKIEAIQYVLKDGGEPMVHNVEITPQMRDPPDRVMELRDSKRKRQAKLDTANRAFHQKLIDLWREEGRPQTHRACCEMLIDHVVLNKWNYCDARSIYRMATYLMLRAGDGGTRRRLLEEIDQMDN